MAQRTCRVCLFAEQILVDGNVKHTNERHEDLKARGLPVVFNGNQVSGGNMYHFRKAFTRQPRLQTFAFDSLTEFLKFKFSHNNTVLSLFALQNVK